MNTKKFNLSDGTYIRYKKIGEGKPLMLFHTFRNRLEYSNKITNYLKEKFSVYLLDLPGFGDSPISKLTNYDQQFFTNSIVELIKHLKIKEITLAGESIGGVLPVTISIKIPKLIKKIFSMRYSKEEKKPSWCVVASNLKISTQTAINLHNKGISILRKKITSEKLLDNI